MDIDLDAVQVPTLGSLLTALRPGTITVLAGNTNVPVAESVICDPEHLDGVRKGDLVLAVGTHNGQREISSLLRRASKADACAVIVAGVTAPASPDLIELSESCGVALLSVPKDVSWGRLYAILRSATQGSTSDLVSSGVPAGDLFGLADAIAAMVGGAVTIEDPDSVVLAYSSDEDIDEPRLHAILGRRVRDDWQRHYRDSGFFKQLRNSTEVFLLPATGQLRPRLVVAVRAAGELLGSIWVAEAGRPLDQAAQDALASAARLTALHLLRYRESEDLDRRRQADDLIKLLQTGRGDPVGLSLNSGFGVSVLAVEPQGVEGPDAVAVLQRLGDLVALICEAAVPGAAAVTLGQRVYAVLPEASAVRAPAVVPQLLERIRGSLHRPVLVGVGSRVDSLAEIPRSRADADLVLRSLADSSSGKAWAHIEEVRAHAVLLHLRDLAAEDPHLLEGPLTRLSAHDKAKGSAYVKTLRAYLEAFGDVNAAAAQVMVHPNTFRYRLRRLLDVSGIDLDNADQRLVAQLQLHFMS